VGIVSRVFIPIGVGRPGAGLRDLDAVPADLGRMTRLFEARGYTTAAIASDLDAAGLRAALGAFFDAAALGPHDAAVLYFTGHGYVVDGDHTLAARGFSIDRSAVTGVKTQELIELVTRRRPRPGKVWVILDCCAAGSVLNEALARTLGSSGAEVFVLAASDAWSSTFDGSFSAAFGAALEAEAGAPSLDRLTAAVNVRRPHARAVAAALSWSRFDFLDEAPRAA
jgi:hypothetical protein